MKPEDIKRSRYWYQKHGVPPPPRLGRKEPSREIPFKIPSNPLCGQDWLTAHLTDYTPEDIEALTIEIISSNKALATVSLADKRGTVKNAVKEYLRR